MNRLTETFSPLGQMCRTVALALIAGVARRVGFHELDARVAALPPGQQAGIVGATLALLFGLSLFAASFGVIGLAVYFAAVVVVVG